MTNLDIMKLSNNRTVCVSRKVRTRHATCVGLHYLLARGRLGGLDVRTYPLEPVICDLLEHAITFNRPSTHFDSMHLRGYEFSASYTAYAIKPPRYHLSRRQRLSTFCATLPTMFERYDVFLGLPGHQTLTNRARLRLA
ncbi:hypothetical protein TNCV_3006691 [Trichonephila clavipes]|nr:hypothetical protein TNCV_3006691 [Trichonephila clavipes]